jgi:hypothetical protein
LTRIYNCDIVKINEKSIQRSGLYKYPSLRTPQSDYLRMKGNTAEGILVSGAGFLVLRLIACGLSPDDSGGELTAF